MAGSQRPRRRRIALGHHADARSNAETALADPQSVNRIVDWTDRHDTDAQPPPRSMTSMVNAAVERVRRHFGAANLETGNRYARVARAMLNHRHWSLAGIPKSSFSHARKKIKLFLEACKIKAKSLQRSSGNRFTLDSHTLLRTVDGGRAQCMAVRKKER